MVKEITAQQRKALLNACIAAERAFYNASEQDRPAMYELYAKRFKEYYASLPERR